MRRHKHRIVNVTTKENKMDLFSSCLFGRFPKEKQLQYIRKAYKDAFDPSTVDLNSEKLIWLYKNNSTSALRIGSAEIEADFHSLNEPVLFMLDATSPTDLIDFWNLRAIDRWVYAIPIQWIQQLSAYCKDFIVRNHVPIPHNAQGLKRRTTIQIARSITEELGKELVKKYLIPPIVGAASQRFWYPTLRGGYSDFVWSPARPILKVKESNIIASISGDANSISFSSLSPDFDVKYGTHYRWANVVNISNSSKEDIATVYPVNTRERKIPNISIGERMSVTTEGLVVYPRFKEVKEYWRLKSGTEAIIEWFNARNVTAAVSEQGKVTVQIMQTLKNVYGVQAISHRRIIELLNDMAHRAVLIDSRDGEDKRKEYYGKHIHFNELNKLMYEINEPPRFAKYSIDRLVDHKVIQLGLEVICNECSHKNWYSVDVLGYTLACENCLKKYSFPARNPTNRALNWSYRAIGPFSKPDYAQGAYTAVLALRFFDSALDYENGITWSTSLNFHLPSGQSTEADFVLWYQRRNLLQHHDVPLLVFGECKSFGKGCFEKKDVHRLKLLATSFPGCILVLATMKDELSTREKELISPLALWGRKFVNRHHTRAAVVILTGIELFASHRLDETWIEKGGKYEKMGRAGHRGNLRRLAEMTQQLYLDLPSYHEWFEQELKKKRKKSKSI